MFAVVLAGGTPSPNDPLYPYTQGRPKALLDMAGKPMVQWVVDALEAVPAIEGLVVVGLSASARIQSAKLQTYLPDQGGLLPNVLAGLREVLRLQPRAEYAALVAGDIPAITPEMVHWMVAQIDPDEPFDIAYTVIRREVMEARFPEARRTYTRLKDITACGGDFHFVRPTLVNTHTEIWERLIAARKNPFKQAAILGWDLLLKLALRRLTLAEAVQQVSRRLGLRGKVVLPPYAELGMDADKPHQVDILRRELARRQARSSEGSP